MTNKYIILLGVFLLYATKISAYKEISSILQQAKDLTSEEINALWPLFNYLQDQYDYIASRVPNDKEPQLMTAYENTQNEFEYENNFEKLLQEHTFLNNNNNNDKYNTTLPSVTELIGVTNIDLTTEELDERADIENLLEDALCEAQTKIDEIEKRSLQLKTQLIKINKPKLVEYVFRALSVLYKIAGRVSRAAYCTYSHIPQLNESLHHIYGGVDCYTYSKHLMLQIEHETVKTVSTIRENVFSLADIYKKIADKKSLLGKLTAIILNLSKITRNIWQSYQTGISAMDKVQNELPDAVEISVNCGRNFADGVPHMIETVTNLSTCITFVDDTTTDYDFMKPENDRHD